MGPGWRGLVGPSSRTSCGSLQTFHYSHTLKAEVVGLGLRFADSFGILSKQQAQSDFYKSFVIITFLLF